MQPGLHRKISCTVASTPPIPLGTHYFIGDRTVRKGEVGLLKAIGAEVLESQYHDI